MKKETLVLYFIFFLALFLRFYKLGEIPYSFHQDEIMNGYVGRFVLLNGKDLYNNSWPLFYFDRFGDYPPILPMYLSGIATFIFGVNEFAVRFPSALLGSIIIFPIYFLGKLIFFNSKTALFACFLTAILPWHIVLSRATSEGVMGLTFFTFGIFLLLKGIKELNKSLILLSLFIFSVTYFLYASFRVLTPLVLVPTPLFIDRNIKKIRFLLIISIFIFIFFTLWIGSTKWGKGRFLQTSLIYSQDVSKSINSSNIVLSNDEGKNNIFLARIFHNKIIGYVQEFSSQYLSYFSTEFLFIKGGPPDRYIVPNQGLLYKFFFFLFFIAFLPSQKKVDKKFFMYFLYLLLIAPLPASLTVDDTPNIHRAIFMILPLIFLSAFGFYKIQNFRYRIISPTLIICFVLIIEYIYFSHQYFRHTASFKSVLRNDGNKELVLFIKNNKNVFPKIIMPVYGTLPLYYLFFTNNFNSYYAGKFRTNIWINRIDKIEFVEEWCPSKMKMNNFSVKTLIIDNGDCETSVKYKEIKSIIRKDSTRAFRLLTLEKNK